MEFLRLPLAIIPIFLLVSSFLRLNAATFSEWVTQSTFVKPAHVIFISVYLDDPAEIALDGPSTPCFPALAT